MKEVEAEVIETIIHPAVKPMPRWRKIFGYMTLVLIIPGLFGGMLATYNIKVFEKPLLYIVCMLPMVITACILHQKYYVRR